MLIAQNDDPELLEWLAKADWFGGGFVSSIARAALVADDSNYPLLIRPLILCACGRECVFLCDWKVPGRKSGTCDAPICGHHAQQVGPGKHLCPEHGKSYEAWRQRHPEGNPLQPSQPSLFTTGGDDAEILV